MTTNAELIERKIAEVLEATSDFDTLNSIYLGLPYKVPTANYPYAVVVVDRELTDAEATGGRVFRAYEGAFVVAVLQQDLPQVLSGRTKIVPSYAAMRGFVDAFVRTFKETANRSLGDLTLSNGRVVDFIVGEDTIEYGWSYAEERADAVNNFGIVPFRAIAVEVM